jgi:hydrogenase expression/formation protein HypC
MCLAIPGEVVELCAERPGLATVNVGGVRRTVNVALVEPEGIAPGDWVLIHVGFAMSKIDEAEAAQTLEYLAGMEQAYADELRALADSSIE